MYLSDLLRERSLGLEVVAGVRAVDVAGPLRWAHISDIPAPASWLEGGELLLTTGFAIGRSEGLQRDLVVGLVERSCPGLGFGIGVFHDEVPAALLEEADRCALPVFTIPYEVPFIAVTKFIFQRIFDERYAELREAISLHRRIVGRVVEGSGLSAILSLAGRELASVDLCLFDFYGNPLACSGDGVDMEVLWNQFKPHWSLNDRITVAEPNGAGVLLGAVVRLRGEAEGVLIVSATEPPTERQWLQIEQTIAGVTLELARDQSARKARRGHVSLLISEAVAQRVSNEMLADQLRALGLRTDGPYQVVAAEIGDASDRVAASFEDALAQLGAQPVVGVHDDVAYALLPASVGEKATTLGEAVRRRGHPQLTLGRSRVYVGVRRLRAALGEAQTAAVARTDEAVVDVDSLGLRGLLAGRSDDDVAHAFVERTVGPIVRHDTIHGTELEKTLRAYLAHGCRPGPAAKELQIHRQTFAHRLQRARELVGGDLYRGRRLVELGVALTLRVEHDHTIA